MLSVKKEPGFRLRCRRPVSAHSPTPSPPPSLDWDEKNDDLISQFEQLSLQASSAPIPHTYAANVSDITAFFRTSSRDENDATNKVREKILQLLCDPPIEYLNDAEFGESWNMVHRTWLNALQQIAQETDIPMYTNTKIEIKGGRRYNYDADVMYYDGTTLVAKRKIEFKNGASTINGLPQILSLQAKFDLFPKTYDTFWYENYLDAYMACDDGIMETKPPLPLYLKKVTSTNYAITPFFAQLKSRELFFQNEKNKIVNDSITDYLTQYGDTLTIVSFSQKIQESQTDKIYLLWHEGMFHMDKLSDAEMSDLSFHSIKNGNILQVKSGQTMYGLLLRWRNHKGILNPAWQISMKRLL